MFPKLVTNYADSFIIGILSIMIDEVVFVKYKVSQSNEIFKKNEPDQDNNEHCCKKWHNIEEGFHYWCHIDFFLHTLPTPQK